MSIKERLMLKKRVLFLLVLIFTSIGIIPASPLFQKATRQGALAAFARSDFEQALAQFRVLSSTYPKDPFYKYYCGVSLVRLEREPAEAVKLLREAVAGSAAIRTVPDDANFWLGRALQMSGSYKEAVDSYNAFELSAGRKKAKEMDIQNYVRQCNEGKGKLVSEAPSEQISENKVPVEERVTVPVKDTAKNEILAIPEQVENAMNQAIGRQQDADSLTTISDSLKKNLITAGSTDRTAIRKMIDQTGRQAVKKRDAADSVLIANKLIEKEGAEEKNVKKVIAVPENAGIMKDTIVATGKDGKNTEPTGQNAIKPEKDTITAKISNTLIVRDKEVFEEFSIIEKPVYSPEDKVAINPELPAGLIYRIQVAVFRNPVSPAYFKGITPINGFKNEANGITTYYAGLFRRNTDAQNALQKVRSKGFKDAFVAAVMDKKNISPERSALLEKEWGTKPLYVVRAKEADTIPKTLVFRIEVKRTPKPLPADQVENIRKASGTRGLDIVLTENKQTIYLIGVFISYKSASEFNDLLIRNGFRESKVTAWLGEREIPIETAKLLFDEH